MYAVTANSDGMFGKVKVAAYQFDVCYLYLRIGPFEVLSEPE